MSHYAGVYGQRKLARMGIINSAVAISDGAATTIASMGDLVIDRTDGKLSYVDSSTQTQELS